jgi:hypothetical protein
MRRYLSGLRSEASGNSVPVEGIFLVRIEGAFYQYHRQRPFLTLHLIVVEPEQSVGRSILGRLYCSAKALWKLRWFLKDFGYDEDLIDRDLVDGSALLGLCGVVRISAVFLKGKYYPSLDGFAPAKSWQAPTGCSQGGGSKK